MPSCEMCGADKTSLTKTKVEGATLELCDSCTDFGTKVRTESSSSGTSKYSTSSDSGKNSGGSSGSANSAGSGGGRAPDMFDDMDTLAADYDSRIRKAREALELTQEELADQLNEKASLIRKLETGDVLPDEEVQQKVETALEVELSEGTDVDDADWSGQSDGSMTLGDVVKRKD
ncbi:MAG: transcriptional regulator, XRE family [uncultured archaeon A07HR60]|nr:MAG: TIGR00270 family protein [Halorubrum sp. J07HR59]ESS12310.1 MAG: transcriptional regulator, XRE family [uncultured archaeon A07HR60]